MQMKHLGGPGSQEVFVIIDKPLITLYYGKPILRGSDQKNVHIWLIFNEKIIMWMGDKLKEKCKSLTSVMRGDVVAGKL